MDKPVRILRRCLGLNNFNDPSAIKMDLSTGDYELSESINVVINDGRPGRRKGYTQKNVSAFHSLTAHQDYMVGVTGNALTVIERDYSTTAIRNVTTGARVRYQQVGDYLYYVNGFEKGYIKDRLSYSWSVGDYYGPTTQRDFSDPPIGNLICLFKSRMYIALGNILWYSEPFAYNTFDFARGFIDFGNEIQMVAASDDTLFISTNKKVLALSGNGPNDFEMKTVFSFPAIKGTEVIFDFTKFPIVDGIFGNGVIWTGSEGICVGGLKGFNLILTTRKVVIPDAIEGNAVIYNGHYITNLVK